MRKFAKSTRVLLAIVMVLSLTLMSVGCDNTDVVVPPVHKHNYVVVTDTAPTCLAVGSKALKCDGCDDKKTESYGTATGHTFGAWSVKRDATCLLAGQEQRTCTPCKLIESKEITKLAHDYKEVAGENDATCTEAGSSKFKCDGCQDTYDEVAAALGHTDDKTKNVVTAATCTEDGFTTIHCGTCGTDFTKEITSALGHDIEETVVAADCETFGTTNKVCKRANCTYVEKTISAAKLAHSFDATTGVCGTCEKAVLDSFMLDVSGEQVWAEANSSTSYTVNGTVAIAHEVKLLPQAVAAYIAADKNKISFNFGAKDKQATSISVSVNGGKEQLDNLVRDLVFSVTVELTEQMAIDGINLTVIYSTLDDHEDFITNNLHSNGFTLGVSATRGFILSDKSTWFETVATYEYAASMWTFTATSGKTIKLDAAAITDYMDKGFTSLAFDFSTKDNQNMALNIGNDADFDGTKYSTNNYMSYNVKLTAAMKTEGLTLIIHYGALGGSVPTGYTLMLNPIKATDKATWIVGNNESFTATFSGNSEKTDTWVVTGSNGIYFALSGEAVNEYFKDSSVTTLTFKVSQNDGSAFTGGVAGWMGGLVNDWSFTLTKTADEFKISEGNLATAKYITDLGVFCQLWYAPAGTFTLTVTTA